MTTTKTIRGVKEMDVFAVEVAGSLNTGDVLLLYGDLGAGKTTFVQGLARALEVKEAVTSPTFNIVAEYGVPVCRGINTLVHVDLYRLNDGEALSDTAVQDVVSRVKEDGRITVVEWADRLGDYFPKGARRIFLEHVGKEERLVRVVV